MPTYITYICLTRCKSSYSCLSGLWVYVRPVVEYNTVVSSPYTIKDIETTERVQRRFTKKLPGLRKFSYDERLSGLRLHSLESPCGRL